MPIDFLALIQEDDGRLLVGNRFRGEGDAMRKPEKVDVESSASSANRLTLNPVGLHKPVKKHVGNLAARIIAELHASGGKGIATKELEERLGVSRARIQRIAAQRAFKIRRTKKGMILSLLAKTANRSSVEV